MQDVQNRALARFLSAPGRFAVFGAGETGASVLGALGALGVKAAAFLDADRTGRHAGLPVLPPEEALGLDHVVLADRRGRDATVRLRADGYEGPVLDLGEVLRAPRAFDEALLDASGEARARARGIFEDDGSRDVFDAVLRYRRELDPGELPPEPPTEAHPAVATRAGERVVALGAGPEAVLARAEAVGPLGRVHVLEAGPARRLVLEDALAGSALGARVEVHAFAWGPRSLGPPGEDDDRARRVTLDELVWETLAGRVDRLCVPALDAAAALAGASATLAERRPCVELDLSGAPDDLWVLPERLAATLSGARLHLTHHGQGLAGTRACARPADRS